MPDFDAGVGDFIVAPPNRRARNPDPSIISLISGNAWVPPVATGLRMHAWHPPRLPEITVSNIRDFRDRLTGYSNMWLNNSNTGSNIIKRPRHQQASPTPRQASIGNDKRSAACNYSICILSTPPSLRNNRRSLDPHRASSQAFQHEALSSEQAWM